MNPKKKPDYDPEEILQSLMDAAVEIYTEKKSLRAVSDELELNPIKVRKLLITAGVYASGTAVDEELREKLAECDVYGRPFCIASDGLNLVEDVGGTGGYESFILSVNEKPETDEQKEERKEILLWAKGLGWTGRKKSPEKML